jgi:pilus assembly protein TadC
VLSYDGLASVTFALLLFAPMTLLGADYLFDEILKVKAELRSATHYRALLYLVIAALSVIVISQSRSSDTYLDTFRVTSESLIWVFALLLITFFLGKSILKQSWSSRQRERIERLDLELPQYLEMFHILITSGMSVLSALKALRFGTSSMGDSSRHPGSRAEMSTRGGPREIRPAWIDARAPMSECSGMRGIVSEILRGVDQGLSIESALDQVVMRAGSEPLRRFADAVILGMERGSSMGQTLRNLINETRTQSKIMVMERAGKAEIKLLIPVVFLILPISVIFAIWPSYVNLVSIMGGSG